MANLLILVALLILYVVFKPKRIPHIAPTPICFFPIGIACGVLGILAGTVGPLLAFFYMRDDFNKEEIIVNKSIMQCWVHFLKIPAFIALGFDFIQNAVIWVPLAIAATIGTKLGIKLLRNIDEVLFRKIFRLALFITAIRLLYKSLSYLI